MVKRFFVFLILAIGCSAIIAQEIKVTAATDTTDYLIGDQIKYSLTIKMDKDVFIIDPFFRDSLKNIDVISISNPIPEESESSKSVKYLCLLSRYDSAEVTIPPIEIEYRTKSDSTLKFALSNPVTVNIHRVNVKMQEEIKDIKPPIRLFNYLFLIYLAIALVLLIIGYFIYKRYLQKETAIADKTENRKNSSA